MEKFSNYIGVVLIVAAAIVLLLSYFLNWMDNNLVQGGAILVMILGAILHAFKVSKAV